jgi:hypothetical protein
MNLRESIEVAIEDVSANKMRAALTMLGVIIGVGAVMGGFGSVESLTLEGCEATAKKCPSVTKAVHEVRQNVQVKYPNQNTNTTITGTSAEDTSRTFTMLLAGIASVSLLVGESAL